MRAAKSNTIYITDFCKKADTILNHGEFGKQPLITDMNNRIKRHISSAIHSPSSLLLSFRKQRFLLHNSRMPGVDNDQ